MILAEVKEADKINDTYSVFLTFNYNEAIINLIRELPIRYWHADETCWEIPIKYFKRLQSQLLGETITIDDENNILAQYEQTNIIDNLPEDYKFKTKPFEHQIDGVKYGLAHNKFLLNDEQGLGKTMQVINVACIKKQLHDYKHCLIICGVNGLKWNWKSEIEKHSNEKGYILGTRIKNEKEIIGSVNDRLEDLNHLEELPYFLITNIETLRNEQIIDKLKQLCKDKLINVIVVDEVHKCFHYDTLITTNKGSLKIGDIVENKINCEALSYNHNTNKYEFKPILNYHNNKVQEELIELEILGEDNKIHKIKCTRNHKIYTENRGYIKADLLTENDKILII